MTLESIFRQSSFYYVQGKILAIQATIRLIRHLPDARSMNLQPFRWLTIIKRCKLGPISAIVERYPILRVGKLILRDIVRRKICIA